MLDSFRRGQRWLTGIFIVVIGGVFVFFMGLGGPMGQNQPAGQAVIEIGDIKVSRGDYLRERQSQLDRFRDSLGDQLNSAGATAFIDAQTMGRLVDAAVMSHAAHDLGLIVTRSEIQNYLRSAPQFRGEDGRFDTENFEGWVEYNFGSQRAFLELMQQDLLRAKLQRLIFGQAIVTETEARSAALHRLEGIQLGYVSLNSTTLPSAKLVADEMVEAYLSDNEADVRVVYAERVDLYRKPEARKTRHILIEIDGTDELVVEAARKRAEDAMQQIVDGAAFEDVALELSADVASRGKGGDIGYLQRGEARPELVEAVFAMEPGGEMRIVQSSSGFHVVRVDEARAETSAAFEEVSLELARELATKAMAQEFAVGLADEISEKVRDGQTLKEAAVAAGVNYELSPTLRRRPDGFMPEVGTSQELMATAFSLTEASPRSDRVFVVGEERILIELLELQPPNPTLLEDETQSEKATLLSQKRGGMMDAWLQGHRKELTDNNLLLIDSTVTGSS
jgi:peptidyl-prolyl cis-trans isomerase D